MGIILNLVVCNKIASVLPVVWFRTKNNLWLACLDVIWNKSK